MRPCFQLSMVSGLGSMASAKDCAAACRANISPKRLVPSDEASQYPTPAPLPCSITGSIHDSAKNAPCTEETPVASGFSTSKSPDEKRRYCSAELSNNTGTGCVGDRP